MGDYCLKFLFSEIFCFPFVHLSYHFWTEGSELEGKELSFDAVPGHLSLDTARGDKLIQ